MSVVSISIPERARIVLLLIIIEGYSEGCTFLIRLRMIIEICFKRLDISSLSPLELNCLDAAIITNSCIIDEFFQTYRKIHA